jgi:hypothetical protein
MSDFPAHFAVLRTLSSRGPHWQFLESKYISSGLSSSQAFYEINSHSWFLDVGILDDVVSNINTPGWMRPKILSVRTQSGELKTITYWKLPMTIHIGNSEFPILHFEYKAWLPRPSSRIPISNSSEVLRTYNTCLHRISNTEDRIERRLFDTLPPRAPTPPRLSRSESPASTDSDGTLSVMTVYPTYHPLDFPPLDFPPLPPSPAASPTPSKPLPIPELVGSLLIQNATTGEDACPISTVPYKELKSLSVTSCFHVFDTESIQTWFKEHKQCPVCRHSIANMITKTIKN